MKSLSDQSGIALLQFAVVVPVLLLFFLAIVDAGFAINAYTVLTRTVHEGVRYGSKTANITDPNVQELVLGRVQDSINVYADTKNIFASIFSDIRVTSTYIPGATRLDDHVEVTAEVVFDGLVLPSFQLYVEGVGPYLL